MKIPRSRRAPRGPGGAGWCCPSPPVVGATAARAAGSSGGSGSLPSTIKVAGSEPETGPAAFAGLSAEKGYKLAVKQINDQQFLGENTTIDVNFNDTKGDIPTAASR